MARITRSLFIGSCVLLFLGASCTSLLHAQKPGPAASSRSSLEIASNRNVFLLVTAPNGLETGFDETVFGGLVNRIPSSKYSLGLGKGASVTDTEDDSLIERRVEIATPSPGRYIVQAIGGFAGRFILRFKATDENGSTAIRKFSGSTWPGPTVVYSVHYPPAPGAKFSVTQLAPLSRLCASVNVSSLSPPTVRVTANFALGPVSKGMDPATQPVSLQFTTRGATIPAGSFIRNKEGDYSFDGAIGNVRFKVRILPKGANNFVFDAEAQGVGLHLSSRPVRLLLVIGNNAGVTPFSSVPCWCAAGKTPAQAVTAAGSANQLARQFECEPVFWKQFEIGKKIVALHNKSVLPELYPLLYPQKVSPIPPSEDDQLTRENAAFIFASLGDDHGFQVIKEVVEDRSNQLQVRYYAAHLFGDLKDPRAVPILIPMLKVNGVQDIVPWSLGQIGDKSAIPPLIQTLDDKDPDMRVLAIYALEQLDAEEALPKLRMLLNDNEKIHFDGLIPVSAAAREAIAKLERKL
jgi:HEAT repeats/PBS lyase HEAT-like repeat